MPHWPKIRSSIVELVGYGAISASLFMLLFGVGVWAQDSISIHDATQNERIAVLQSRQDNTERRVGAIEDRLFGLLLTSGGAVIAALTSNIFLIRIHRQLKNGKG